MIYSKKSLVCFMLAVASTVSATTVANLMKRQIATSRDCAAERTTCLNEATCRSCWSAIETTTDVLSSMDCPDYVAWFKSVPLAQSCDYTTRGSALSDLAYCYFDSTTKNYDNIDCILTDACAVQQSTCDSDVYCSQCFSEKTPVFKPGTDSCADYQAYYVDTMKSFPLLCSVSSPVIQDLVKCRYDSMTLASGVNCPVDPGTGSDVCATIAVKGTMGFDGTYELCPRVSDDVNVWIPVAGNQASIQFAPLNEWFGSSSSMWVISGEDTECPFESFSPLSTSISSHMSSYRSSVVQSLSSTSVASTANSPSSRPFYYNLGRNEWYYYDDTGRNVLHNISFSCLKRSSGQRDILVEELATA